jgi:hypothetical protein
MRVAAVEPALPDSIHALHAAVGLLLERLRDTECLDIICDAEQIADLAHQYWLASMDICTVGRDSIPTASPN